MDTKKLRQKILDLAIRGKLVPPACRQAGKTLTMNPLPRTECKKCWYTYVIECEDGSFYKGFTDNLVRRYEQHCNGTGAEHTKKHKPKQLFYWEMHYSQEEAVAREKFLKSGVGREWFKREVVDKPESWEPASVLLERIRAEKERLIKEGKTRLSGRQVKRSKKSASDTPHYENRQVGEANEVPFEVPESWEWTNLGDITNYGNCENVDVNDIPKEGWVLELEDLEKDSAKIIQQLTKDERDIKGVRHSFHKGDVLYSKLRTYLNKVMVANEDGFCTTEIIPITCMSYVLPEYLNHVLRSKYFVDYTIQCGYGVKMPRLSTTDACNGQIPLPPYNEQKHIVASIEGWFQLIDILESDQADLDEAIQKAKSKILDLAIHGKLVPQDPNDEPAIDLLKRINPKFTACDNAHYENT